MDAVTVWYAASHAYYSGGFATPADVDRHFTELFEWGTAVPDVETWGGGTTPGGMAALSDMLSGE